MTTNDDGGETNLINQILGAQTQYLKETQEHLTKISKDVASIKRSLAFLVIVVVTGIVLSICGLINSFLLSYRGL